jgi:hypothetical protein
VMAQQPLAVRGQASRYLEDSICAAQQAPHKTRILSFATFAFSHSVSNIVLNPRLAQSGDDASKKRAGCVTGYPQPFSLPTTPLSTRNPSFAPLVSVRATASDVDAQGMSMHRHASIHCIHPLYRHTYSARNVPSCGQADPALETPHFLPKNRNVDVLALLFPDIPPPSIREKNRYFVLSV